MKTSAAQLSLLEARLVTSRASSEDAIPLLEWRAEFRKRSAPLVVGYARIVGDEIQFDFPALKLHSLNKSGFGMSRGAAMAEMSRVRVIRETVRQSIARVVGAPLRPGSVTITRLSTGAGIRDDDNLAGACKPAIDGIAKALAFDDSILAIISPKLASGACAAAGFIPLYVRQGKSLRRGVFGVRIELLFGGAP